MTSNDKKHDKFVLDTCALLKASNILFDLIQKQGFLAIIPHIVIDELDRLKDDPKHKENRNAHKVLLNIDKLKCKKICNKIFQNGSNDSKIIQCAKLHDAWIISEDKTFKINYNKTLKIAEFREKFKDNEEDIPDNITQEFFNALDSKDINIATRALPNIKVNAYNHEGQTPLIYAIKLQNILLIKSLLTNKDINLHKCDNKHLKMTPLAHAVQLDNIEIVSLLLQSGAKPYIANKGANKANTPFLMACWDRRKNALCIIKLLLNYGISINQVDGNGFSGLIKASIKGHRDVVQLLLSKGADTKIRDFNNKDALTHAQENNHQEIIKLLKEH